MFWIVSSAVLSLGYLSALWLLRRTSRTRKLEFNHIDPDTLLFPRPILMGAATSAHQVEGDTCNNNWTAWEVSDHPNGNGATIHRSERCGRAVDHWNRFDEDLQLMVDLGLEMYRFSIEWSRVEPEPGKFNDEALMRYRSWCEKLRAVGIKPMVTLHHFTDPQWLSSRGGFEETSAVDAFGRYVRHVVPHLSDLVDHWITVNEPGVYAVQGWYLAEFPPGKIDPHGMLRVMRNLMVSHARAYHLIHEDGHYDEQRPCIVSFANNLVDFQASNRYSIADLYLARWLHKAFNQSVMDGVDSGYLDISAPGKARLHGHYPELKGTWDFVAINHYFRKMVSFHPFRKGMVAYDFDVRQGTNDMGWGLTPQSLYDMLHFARRYGKPIYITENGICDGENPDQRRQKYLLECLHAVQQAMSDGVDVRAYLYWSLLDNFEWAYGFAPRFGLYRVQYETLNRSLTGGGRLYKDIIERNQVSQLKNESV